MNDIFLLHTASVHQANFDALGQTLGVDLAGRHQVDATLLARSMAAGRVTEDVVEDLERILRDLKAQGVKGVLCTCSSIGSAAERAGETVGIPTLRVDRAMAEAACDAGSHWLVAACLESTLAPTEELLRDVARDRNVIPTLDLVTVPEAWPLFEAGDIDGYAKAIADRVRGALGGHDAIVLAQASMRPAETVLADCGVPVLSSPLLGLKKAIKELGAQHA